MKRFMTVVLLYCSAASAGDYEVARQEAYSDAMIIATIKGTTTPCAVVGILTANIMVNRLNNEPMSSQMTNAEFSFYRYVIQDAYNQPFYQTAKAQQRLVRDFRERYEVECYSVLGSAG